MSSFRVAIIGLGVIGRRMLTNMAGHSAFEPVIGFDRSEKARKDIIGDFPDFRVAKSMGEIFSDPDAFDILYIGTPPLSHAEIARKGIEAGCGIFCEKPLGIDMDTSRALTGEINSRGVLQAVNFVFSGAPATIAARKHIEDGKIGDVLGAELILKFAEWPRRWQADAVWVGERAEGGLLREVASHYAYLARELLGELKPAEPVIVTFPCGNISEDMVMGQWISSSGPVSINARVGGVRKDVVRFRILGNRGSLVFENWYRLYHETKDKCTPLLDDASCQPAAAYMGQLDRLAMQIKDGEKRLADFTDALAVQSLIEATLAGAGS